MRKEELVFLSQLLGSLEQAEVKLKESYDKGDAEGFNKVKSFIFQIQRKIDEVVK